MPQAGDLCRFCSKERCDHDPVPDEPGELTCPLAKWQRKENAATPGKWVNTLRFSHCDNQYLHFEPSY